MGGSTTLAGTTTFKSNEDTDEDLRDRPPNQRTTTFRLDELRSTSTVDHDSKRIDGEGAGGRDSLDERIRADDVKAPPV